MTRIRAADLTPGDIVVMPVRGSVVVLWKQTPDRKWPPRLRGYYTRIRYQNAVTGEQGEFLVRQPHPTALPGKHTNEGANRMTTLTDVRDLVKEVSRELGDALDRLETVSAELGHSAREAAIAAERMESSARQMNAAAQQMTRAAHEMPTTVRVRP